MTLAVFTLFGSAHCVLVRVVHLVDFRSLFVSGISLTLTSDQLISDFFPDCLKVMLFAFVLRHGGSDRIVEMRCLFIEEGLNALFIMLPHWDEIAC